MPLEDLAFKQDIDSQAYAIVDLKGNQNGKAIVSITIETTVEPSSPSGRYGRTHDE